MKINLYKISFFPKNNNSRGKKAAKTIKNIVILAGSNRSYFLLYENKLMLSSINNKTAI